MQLWLVSLSTWIWLLSIKPDLVKVKLKVDLAAKLAEYVEIEAVNIKTQIASVQAIMIQYNRYLNTITYASCMAMENLSVGLYIWN